MYPKRFLVALSLLICCVAAWAQDVIVLKDGTSLLGKVAEITDTEVKYSKANNPNGPLYTVKVADLMRVNYENGESDIFSTEGAAPATVLTGTTGDVTDPNLLNLYKKQSADYKLPRKLKLTAFIGGGALIVGGLITLLCWDGNTDGTSKNRVCEYIGISTMAVGVVWMPTFYLIARHKQKKLNELACAPLFRQEIFAKNGKSLSMGVDFMADRMKTRTLGLGMTFSF